MDGQLAPWFTGVGLLIALVWGVIWHFVRRGDYLELTEHQLEEREKRKNFQLLTDTEIDKREKYLRQQDKERGW